MTEIQNQRPLEPDHAAVEPDTEVSGGLASGIAEHPADVADRLTSLSPEQCADVLDELPPEQAAGALEEMRKTLAAEVLQEMSPEAAARAVALMAPDHAADVLAEMEKSRRAALLAELPTERHRQLEQLLSYAPDSAGGIMSPQVTALPQNLPIAVAIAQLRELAHRAEQIYYTYVVDERGRLVGVLSLRDLILAGASQTIEQIMIRNVLRVRTDQDRETVAALLTKYGYLALPVVDADDRLVGLVTVDDAVQVLETEATEDLQRMVGAGPDERIDSPVPLVLKRRTLWLLVNLGTGFLAAFVVGAFEHVIAQLAVLAVLLGVVAGQAGNTGLQSMAVMIRAFATGQTRGLALWRILYRELLIGAGSGLAVGVVALIGCYLWRGDLALSAVLGLALFLCTLVATISGALVPWLMQRLGFDPAQSASIILTTITDVSGFGIFLLLASFLLLNSAPAPK